MSFVFSTLLMVMLYTACGIAAGAAQKAVGFLSIGHAVILSSGAYAYALVARSAMNSFSGFLAALLVGALTGVCLTAVAARVNDERFAIITFGIQIVWIGLISNVESITGGVFGISGIPAPSPAVLLTCATVLVTMAAIILIYLTGTPFAAGCAIFARNSELAATMGLRSMMILLCLGTVYGTLVGLAGGVLAAQLSFIDPTLFTIGTSVTILAIAFFVVAGGILGGLLGGVVLVGIPQLVRLLGISTATAGYLQLMLSGFILILATVVWIKTVVED